MPELAGGAVVMLGRVDVALLGGIDEPPELIGIEVDSAGTVTVVEPEEPGGGAVVTEGGLVGGGGGFPVPSDAGGASLAGGVASEDCEVTGGGDGADDSGVPGGFPEETGGLPAGGGVPDAGGGVPEAGGAVPGTGGVTEFAGGDSTGVVPGTGGTTVAGGLVSHTVTVTVSVTVLATSDKSKYQRRQSEV